MDKKTTNMESTNNKLIAEFMGVDYVDIDTYLENNKELQYHTSWDWLMPVVQKCLDVSNDDNIEDFYSIQNVVPNIEATYNAVVEFIKEYNDEQ
jgi:hypothetical protein